MKIKKLALFVLMLALLFSSSIYYIKEAKAQIATAITAKVVSTTGAILSSDLLLATGTSILGAMGAVMMVMYPSELGNGEMNSVRIPLVADTTKTDPAMPPPVVPAAVSSSLITADKLPVGTSFQRCYFYDGVHSCGGGGLTPEACCQGFSCGLGGVRYCAAVNQGVPVQYQGKTLVYSGTTNMGDQYFNGSAGCPSGYVAGGSGCTLTNANLVKSDGNSDLFVNASGGLSWKPDIDTAPPNVSVADGGGKIWGTNSDGQPFLTTITPRSDGGSDILTQTQVTSGGNTFVRSDTISLSPSGTVTSAVSGTVSGNIPISTTAGTAPVVNTNAEATSKPIVFPDDYARQGTAAATQLNTKSIAESLTKTSEVSDLTPPLTSDFSNSFFNKTFDNLLEWTPPQHVSTCPTSSFNALSETFTIDAHCALMEDNKGPLQTAMSVIYLLTALFIVLKA